ncbi:MAG: carboxypeptidase M32 [Oligoflexia bacterium]|nr:carboxypeptidase M32 [Oligoflexia bacterium]
MNKSYDELLEKCKKIELIEKCSTLLAWDRDCYMPSNAYKYRGEQIEFLSSMAHRELTSPEFEKALQKAEQDTKVTDAYSTEAVNLKHIRRTFDRSKKIPEDLVKRMAVETTAANRKWITARKEGDFSIFAPNLEIVVNLCREQALIFKKDASCYQALVDIYEPEMSIETLNDVFSYLKKELVTLVDKIKNSGSKPDMAFLKNRFDVTGQAELGVKVVKAMGFDFDSGRLDITTHPFCTRPGPMDTRIATRYSEDDLLSALYGSIHEAGHGLYDQGLPREHFGTPAGDFVSMGTHESQSLMWEKVLGKSRGFIEFLLPLAKKLFPEQLGNTDIDSFYRASNHSEPSFIRVEADEVTYNLHIIARFEIEQMLIDGGLDIKDVPEVWNSKYREYLGINPPDDRQGCLQDVHWSFGLFGYFPSYTLGYLYAAQFYNKMQMDLGDVDLIIKNGNFTPVLDWLRKNIHSKGKRYNSTELIKKVTGSDFSAKPFVEYLNKKFGEIYS